MYNMRRRIDALERHTNGGQPDPPAWVVVGPEDDREELAAKWPGVKQYDGVSPDDWDEGGTDHGQRSTPA